MGRVLEFKKPAPNPERDIVSIARSLYEDVRDGKVISFACVALTADHSEVVFEKYWHNETHMLGAVTRYQTYWANKDSNAHG